MCGVVEEEERKRERERKKKGKKMDKDEFSRLVVSTSRKGSGIYGVVLTIE